MKFLHPEFLFALFSLSIPIVIHLFQFRRAKRIAFSNVRFLKEIKEERHSTSRLRELLILLSRLLLLTFLIFAFAQPYIPSTEEARVHDQIGIYVDNSFSMDQLSSQGRGLDNAKRIAHELVKSHPANTEYLILSNDFRSKGNRFQNRERSMENIASIESNPLQPEPEELLNRFSTKESSPSLVYMISDFQFDTLQLDGFSKSEIRLIPIQIEQKSNLSIDSCWFEIPVRKQGASEIIHFELSNYGNEDERDVQVNLFINGSQRSQEILEIPAGSKIRSNLSYKVQDDGFIEAELRIDDYPVTFDNSLYFSYQIRSKYNILGISNDEKLTTALGNLLEADSSFHYEIVKSDKAEPQQILEADLIILADLELLSSGLIQTLGQALQEGSDVCLFPSPACSIEDLNALLSLQEMSRFRSWDTSKYLLGNIALEHPFFEGVFERIPENIDLPKGRGRALIEDGGASGEELLISYSDGQPFLRNKRINGGQMYVFSSPLSGSYGNMSKHALFVPSIYQMILRSNESGPLFQFIGKEDWASFKLPKQQDPEAVYLLAPKDSLRYIPIQRRRQKTIEVKSYENLVQSGFYRLKQNDVEFGILAFNFNRKESDMTGLDLSSLENMAEKLPMVRVIDGNINEIRANVERISSEQEYWKTALLLALMFVFFEIALIKLWKR